MPADERRRGIDRRELSASDAAVAASIGRLERIADQQRKERRWWRGVVVLFLLAAGFTATKAAEAVRAVDAIRAEAAVRCERGNVFRSQVARMGEAEQERWDKVTAVLRLDPEPGDTPERTAFKDQFRLALDRADSTYAAALSEVRPVDCTPTLTNAAGP